MNRSAITRVAHMLTLEAEEFALIIGGGDGRNATIAN